MAGAAVTLGIIGRCDQGGLASITREVFRHLAPERTLVLDLADRGRGECADRDYTPTIDGQSVHHAPFAGALPTSAIDWLCAPGVDTIWTAETFYDDRILRAARASGVRTVVHAMPELAPWATGAPSPDRSAPVPTQIMVPTSWRADTLPAASVLAVPVATDRLRHKQRDRVDHLYHVTGAAMLDRNGTDLLLRALPHITADVHVTIRSERPVHVPTGTRVQVDVVEPHPGGYWAHYPDDADVLVMPRRYGGLSLPVQEAAALGIVPLVLDVDAYAHAEFTVSVRATRSRDQRMKGGRVPVWDADPREIARAIDMLATMGVWHESQAARVWADAYAWSGPLGARWCSLLDANCEREAAA